MDEDNNYQYLGGAEVVGFENSPPELDRLQIAPATWAVFRHEGHVAEIQAVCQAIWGQWLPASGREPVDAPFIKRYPPPFDPLTGRGGFEIWLAVR